MKGDGRGPEFYQRWSARLGAQGLEIQCNAACSAASRLLVEAANGVMTGITALNRV